MTVQATEAANLISAGGGETPSIGLILGSGLGMAADQISDAVEIDFGELPGFPRPSVAGHSGTLILGELGGQGIACMKGRVHTYEGDVTAMLTPVRTLKLLGCEILIVTNAAGCLVAEWPPGSLMLITDHINLQPSNPLVGANDSAFGPRFPDLTEACDADLRQRFHAVAKQTSIPLQQGVYIACTGPYFETPAEIRAFRTLGADAVGMSTAPEVIVARHCGLRVAGVSVLTNLAAGMTGEVLSHEDTLASAATGVQDFSRLLAGVLESLSGSP